MSAVKRFITILLLSLLFSLCPLRLASADQYGGGEEVKKISIDKQVLNPATSQWVENLFITDHLFRSGDEVQFRITITNTSNVTIDRIEVQDFLPSFLDFISGPRAFVIQNLGPGQSYTTDPVIRARIKNADQLNLGTFCENNLAQAYFDNQTYEDTAQICYQKEDGKEVIVTKGGLEIKELPQTGPALGLISLAGSAAMALAGGILIRKKS